MPTGISTITESHIPTIGPKEPSFTNFSPNVLNKWKIKKKMIATTNGIPKPPLRIIEPRGAPIKNKIIQANDKENFLCHSILWYLISFLRTSISPPVFTKLFFKLFFKCPILPDKTIF